MAKVKENGAVLCRGLDCAPKVIAYTYAKNLIERGIVGHPLCWKLLKKNYVCGYISSYGFYFHNRKDLHAEPGNDPLWRPEEIPPDIWEKAVQGFTGRALEDNLLYCLLPLIGDIKTLIAYDKLLDLTQRLVLDEDILGWAIRVCGDDVYYFNAQTIYTKGTMEDVQEEPESRKWRHRPWSNERFNQTVWNKAAVRFRVGATLRECIDLFFQTELISAPLNYTYLDRLVTRIDQPEYEREPENNNLRTFDRIRVQVNLSYTLHPTIEELTRAVRKHRNQIDAMVLAQIEEDRKFRRFGVPLNVLKLGALTLYGRTLEYIFELKRESI